jgi:hypothetical protein
MQRLFEILYSVICIYTSSLLLLLTPPPSPPPPSLKTGYNIYGNTEWERNCNVGEEWALIILICFVICWGYALLNNVFGYRGT